MAKLLDGYKKAFAAVSHPISSGQLAQVKRDLDALLSSESDRVIKAIEYVRDACKPAVVKDAVALRERTQRKLVSEFDLFVAKLNNERRGMFSKRHPAPDTSFVRHITPLADLTSLDTELKERCLPILGAGASDPKLWDSAVRTAGVILEERLRDVGKIADPQAVGRDLVNKVFGKTGTLAGKFAQDSEREGYRDLYAGVVGAFRNPSAHRLVDPRPDEGGAFIVFVNLLLRKLDALR